MPRNKEALRNMFSIYILLIAIVLLAAQRSGKSSPGKFENQEDCLNITETQWNHTHFDLEPCVKLWTEVNCRGKYVSQHSNEIVKSVGDCSLCKSKNRKGTRCTGPSKSCIKTPSICDKALETPDGKDIEISESGNAYEVRNVPITIEALDIRKFKLFDPLKNESEEGPHIPLILYRKSDPNRGIDAETVEFRNDEKVIIYIHGYATTMLGDGTHIKNAVFEGTSDVDSVILVDWRKWSLPLEESYPIQPPNYKAVALSNVPIVAEHVHHFILNYLQNENYIYLVGFGFGGHIAGTAARQVAKDGPVVDRISALDPSGPIFEYTLNGVYPLDTSNTLRVSDATFVDLIHCSKILGMAKPVGHLDTYLEENDCKLPYCVHRRAIQMYVSSLKRCSLITCPKSGEACSPLTVSSYGYLSDIYPGRGSYVLWVFMHWGEKGVTPWIDEKCSEYLNLYLPAKNRVCLESLNGKGDCNGYPYLTECSIACSNRENSTSSVCSTDINVRLEFENSIKNHVQSLKFSKGKQDKVKWHSGNCTR